MNGWEGAGRYLILAGLLLLLVGGFIMAGGRLTWLGRLPGDIRIQRGGFSLYFPLATCLLASLLLTALLRLFGRR